VAAQGGMEQPAAGRGTDLAEEGRNGSAGEGTAGIHVLHVSLAVSFPAGSSDPSPSASYLALLHRSVTSLSRPLLAAGGDNTEKGTHEELELRRRLQHLVASASPTVTEQRWRTHEELDPCWCVLH
jgi:hypothetical protein